MYLWVCACVCVCVCVWVIWLCTPQYKLRRCQRRCTSPERGWKIHRHLPFYALERYHCYWYLCWNASPWRHRGSLEAVHNWCWNKSKRIWREHVLNLFWLCWCMLTELPNVLPPFPENSVWTMECIVNGQKPSQWGYTSYHWDGLGIFVDVFKVISRTQTSMNQT